MRGNSTMVLASVPKNGANWPSPCRGCWSGRMPTTPPSASRLYSLRTPAPSARTCSGASPPRARTSKASHARSRGGALVLSTEAGAAADLGADALLVNPYDVTATARALHAALTMDHSERARRAESLARAAAADPPARWLASQLEALDETAVSRAR